MKFSYTNAFTLVAFAALLTLAVPAWAGVIYTQPWSGTSDLYAAQNDTGGLAQFALTYDQFTLPVSTLITGVNWTGGYFNPPNQGAITAWTVNFYADSGGTPGTLLASFVSIGSGNETSIGCVGSPVCFPFYSYSSNANFFAAANVRYWLSVVPDLGLPPQWGWGTSPFGSGTAYQCFFGSCGFLPTTQICTSGACNQNFSAQAGVHLAFDLTGTEVPTPEPGTMVLLGSGFVGVASLLRRKINL